MSHPLSAAYYADRAVWWRGPLVANERIARDTYRVRIHAPEMAQRIVPGQFVMLRLANCNDPLLARPLALYDVVLDAAGTPTGIDLVYLTLGKMTHRLAALQPGAIVEATGPLGNGFSPQPVEHLVMVAGGIGQTPFLALGAEQLGRRTYGDPPRRVPPASRVTLCYGARTADYLAGLDDFERAGISLRISTDDGTRGHHGLVTDLLRQVLAEHADETRKLRIACCGPEPMMEAVSEIAVSAGVACEVSLETPMACGIGICFSCVAKVQQPDGSWDYKRTCVEGPIFDAAKIVW